MTDADSAQRSKILAVIPARGGSKGIPGKNLRVIAGRSLLGWSIAAAHGSRYQMRIVVSTDSEEIAAEARREGAEVVIRPKKIAGDLACSEIALLHTLEELESAESYMPDFLVFLQCTSPLTTSQDIDGTIDSVVSQRADCGLAVAPIHYFLWHQETSGDWSGVNHEKSVRLRRQDREPEFVETGSVYVMRVAGFKESRHRFFGNTVVYQIAAERWLEIDEPADLEFAEFILSRRLHADRAVLLRGAKAVVFDFDGVLTDNRVLTSSDGVESVLCNRSDGLAIEMLRAAGFQLLILSKERNPVVKVRGAKLNILVRQGVDEKRPALEAWCAEKGIALADVVYVGNDINDLDCLQSVGFPVAVADAHNKAKAAARLVLTQNGGQGAVRELAELLIRRTSS